MNRRSWQILCWNIRGLNDSNKWDAVRNKIEECACSIFCLQETKKQDYDSAFIRNFAPRRFDRFNFIPSIGASGGILLVWNSSTFNGVILDKERFGITAIFTSTHNAETWKLTAVYGPCSEPARSEFLSWFRGHSVDDDDKWLFIGDFNFYRSLENRNRPGGNFHDTILFNDAIGHLGLIELPIKGRAFTWSNMQQNPLLEQLDWFFTSVGWTGAYPMIEVVPLAKVTSDHVPCKVMINTTIPKSNIFRFKNYWIEHSDFIDTVQNTWTQDTSCNNPASNLAAKLKKLRQALKLWSKNWSNLNLLISNCNTVILFFDGLEERRELYNTKKTLEA